MSSMKSAVPEIEISTWNHGDVKGGVVFTATTKTEIKIDSLTLIKAIQDDTDSKTLSSLLNKIADLYNSHNGYFAMPYAECDLTVEAKEFLRMMVELIKDKEDK